MNLDSVSQFKSSPNKLNRNFTKSTLIKICDKIENINIKIGFNSFIVKLFMNYRMIINLLS